MSEPVTPIKPPARAVKKPAAAAPATAAPAAPATPGTDQTLPLSARELRAYRSRKIGIRFLIFVGVPTIVACVYYLAIASPEYDATAVVAIQSTSPNADEVTPTHKSTPHQRQASLLADHVRAMKMSSALEIAATVDAASGAVQLRVRATEAGLAGQVMDEVVTASRAWVEAQSARARTERITPAERDVADKRAKLAAGGDRELAQLELDVAIDALKQARLDAAHAQMYLVTIDEVRAHGEPAWPRPAWNILTVFVCATVLVAVGSLLGAAVREHANF